MALRGRKAGDQSLGFESFLVLLALVHGSGRLGAEQSFEAFFERFGRAGHQHLIDFRFRIERCQREVLFRGQCGQEAFLDRPFGHQDIDLDRVGLAHAVSAGDPLFQHGRIPRQIDVDHGVGGLQIEPG